MLIVALTGGIATGKSVAAQIFEGLGCHIFHADKIAHDFMEPGKPAWDTIVSHFGEKILNPDQTINRIKLGKIIFSNPEDRNFLNHLLHPLVLARKKEVIAELGKREHVKIFISEAALTIEAGFIDFFDKVVVTFCQREIQLDRLCQRDSISREEAAKKIESQMNSEEKLKFADYIIDTSGSLPSTIEQTERVFRSLVVDYDLKHGSNPIKKESTS
jgi:dephospho-CoA kinase